MSFTVRFRSRAAEEKTRKRTEVLRFRWLCLPYFVKSGLLVDRLIQVSWMRHHGSGCGGNWGNGVGLQADLSWQAVGEQWGLGLPRLLEGLKHLLELRLGKDHF